MHRTGLFTLTLLLLVFAVGGPLVSPQSAAAQEVLRDTDVYKDGDPTDPERVLHNLEELQVDVDRHGFTADLGDLDFTGWLEQIYATLRAIGLMSAEEPSP